MSVRSHTDHIQIAKVIGIPIYRHFSWLIIFGLIVWTCAMRPLTDAIVTEPDVPLPVAIARMAQAGTARLLVMHGDRLVGLLTTNEVIRRLKVREELAG